jgi:hypothetical protein
MRFWLAYTMDAAVQREKSIPCMAGLPEVSQLGNYCPNALPVEGRGEIRRSARGCAQQHAAQRKFQFEMNPDSWGRVHLFIYFMALA